MGKTSIAAFGRRACSRLALAVCAVAVAWPAAATETLKFGYILSPQSQLGGGATVFASEIAARTGGRYRIEGYPNAMLGGEVEMMKGLTLGVVDLAFITGAPLPKVIPEAGIFNIPFLFRNAADARALLDSPIGDAYLKKFDRTGMVALAWGENGVRHLTNSKRPVTSPDDIAGLRLRLPQSDIMSTGFKAMGADVQQIAFPEVYSALQSDRVDGQENPIATILASKFAEVQTYLTLTAHVYDPAVILMSKDAFDSLSDADKVAFRAAAKAAAHASRDIAAQAERTGIASLQAAGMKVTFDVDRAAFAEKIAVVSPVYDEKFGHDTVEAMRNYRAPPEGSASQASARP